ncbi:MAG: tetratricopeptide repeat protein [Gallionella sp.]
MRKAISLMLLAVLGTSARAEDIKDPSDPYGVIKYALPYAEKGNVTGQLTVASTYYYGKHVPQDYTKAIKWFRLAAKQGDTTAQNFLALMYLKGQGVTQDPVRAQMWSDVAAASGKQSRFLTPDDLAQTRSELAKQLSPKQAAEAQKIAKECIANNYKGCE